MRRKKEPFNHIEHQSNQALYDKLIKLSIDLTDIYFLTEFDNELENLYPLKEEIDELINAIRLKTMNNLKHSQLN